VFEARMHLRRAVQGHDSVVADLTWTDALAGELMFEFDMVLVPTSVSEIELAATSGFLSRHRWVFDSAITKSPALLVCPTRVLSEQLNSNIFTRQRFPVSFMLAPPILESQSARDMYEQGYLMDLPDACGESFLSFAQAVVAADKAAPPNANAGTWMWSNTIGMSAGAHPSIHAEVHKTRAWRRPVLLMSCLQPIRPCHAHRSKMFDQQGHKFPNTKKSASIDFDASKNPTSAISCLRTTI